MATKERGVCPYCGSEDIDYITSETECDNLDWHAKCNACGKRFIEGYHIVFDGMFDEDGEEIE